MSVFILFFIIYSIIGVAIAEFTISVLRKDFSTIYNNMQGKDFLLVYVLVGVFWLPMLIMTLFKIKE